MINTLNNYTAPIAIGAIGGSGTRVIASIFAEMNISIGSSLNYSLDNLFFTFFFKYRKIKMMSKKDVLMLIELFTSANIGPRRILNDEELDLFTSIYKDKYHSSPNPEKMELIYRQIKVSLNSDKLMPQRWGWKEPNSHVILSQLLEFFPGLRYIHVIRNGLDMAYSSNQNQPKLWGSDFLHKPYEAGPAFSLSYWCEVHRNIVELRKQFPDHIHIVFFEKLCADPMKELGKMLDFCNIRCDSNTLIHLAHKISSPQAIGRFRQLGTDHFDPHDIQFVAEMGFPVS